MTKALDKSELYSQNVPYNSRYGELWGAYCEDFEENWPRDNGTAMHLLIRSDQHPAYPIYQS